MKIEIVNKNSVWQINPRIKYPELYQAMEQVNNKNAIKVCLEDTPASTIYSIAQVNGLEAKRVGGFIYIFKNGTKEKEQE